MKKSFENLGDKNRPSLYKTRNGLTKELCRGCLKQWIPTISIKRLENY